MNIQEARERIKQAKAENSTRLRLYSYVGEKLTSKDVAELLSEIKELKNLTILDLDGNKISDIEVLAQLTELTTLYLNDTQISDIKALGQLPKLTSLYLRGTQISDIEALGQLPKLTELNLSGNKISDIEALAQLTELTTLNLNDTQISDIKALGQLPKLTSLYLRGTQISDIEVLAQLTGLMTLNLSGTQISDIEVLAQLTGLMTLYLSGTQISDIEALGQLPKLTLLDLDGNKISDIEVLAQLTELTTLYLNDTQISDIEALGQLPKLTELYLNNTQISDIEALGQLSKLTELYLSGTQISDIKALGQLVNLTALDLRGNNKLNFPEEILSNYHDVPKILNFINEYYREKKKRKLNEAKLVVIGEANIGKTCVINRLVHNEFRKTDSTHGIQIIHWDNIEHETDERERIDVNVWDFGGQEIMHATHQFFFTNRTVYVLVVNARENEDTNKTEEWLQRISSFSKNSPIFIVGNKIDENNRGANKKEIGYFDIDKKNLNIKFPEMIKGFYPVSSKEETPQYKELFDEFKQALITEIKKLEGITNEFPEHWFKVKDELEKMQENKTSYIEKSEYITKCAQAGIDNEVNQTTWLDFLNDLGIIITYRKDADLNHTLILNPAWITKGVYALVDNSQIAIKKGILKFGEISGYLKDQIEYPKKKQRFIIKMMEKFKLLIPIKKEDVFLIPDLLPKEEPFTGEWKNSFHFQFEYEIYEKSIIRRFIVDMYYLQHENTFWRNGIVLKYQDNTALVKADIHAKTIYIKIDGNENTRREFFSVIRNKFDEIHQEFDNLKVEKKVGHPKNSLILEDYDKLLQMERDGQREVYIKDFGNYKVSEFLLSIYRTSEDQAILQPQNAIVFDRHLESPLQLLTNKQEELNILNKLVEEDTKQLEKIKQKANKTATFKSIVYWALVLVLLGFWIGLVFYLGWDYMEQWTYVVSIGLGLLFTFISCLKLDEYAGFSPKKIKEKELEEQMSISNFDNNLYELKIRKITEVKHEMQMISSNRLGHDRNRQLR